MTREELAAQYKISVRTLARWCERLNIVLPDRVRLTPFEVETIKKAIDAGRS